MKNMLGNTSSSSDRAGSNTVKFLCSYAGKILPRYPDGKLRYVGGETRVLSVVRSVTFSDLAVKMAELCGETVVSVRCQLPSEDLDALVSVTCDEDLKNLIEEYDRASQERAVPLKIKAFLSPRKPRTPPSPPKNPAEPDGKTLPIAGGTRPIILERCVHQTPLPVRFPSRFMIPGDKLAGNSTVQYHPRLAQGSPRNYYPVHNGNHWQ